MKPGIKMTSPRKGDTVLIQELAKGANRVQAAASAGVHPNTVTARLADPDFRKLVTDHRSLFLDEVAGILSSAAVGAALKLEELYDDDSRPDHVQRSAARDILEFVIRIRELSEIERRIDMLEDLLVDDEMNVSSVS